MIGALIVLALPFIMICLMLSMSSGLNREAYLKIIIVYMCGYLLQGCIILLSFLINFIYRCYLFKAMIRAEGFEMEGWNADDDDDESDDSSDGNHEE
ncbi:hypothetical protein GCK72_019869 [Caenorhabditis remanei]|uniref:Uncharacterized protein n=2 Tax=Caenorhabditis remanei TaxID=31234 RepID=E3LJC9_CAERE|nr:hypothetical protein GCK72_019869 [Caenorhabditis remanei]EFO95055.1 hypothetical protein CRE_08683 [Caenorhabditis remanei]KAF1753313.1 hypothetical protein GCK72_019869 [Caenorhabditis remanei]